VPKSLSPTLGELLLERGDLLLLRLLLSLRSALGLERRRGVLEELALPAVEVRGLDIVLVAKIGNRNFIDQVTFEDFGLVLRRG